MAIYRKSVKTVQYEKPWMNRPLPPITDDIFSQMPSQQDSYIMDSFCVADDHVSFGNSNKQSIRLAKYGLYILGK